MVCQNFNNKLVYLVCLDRRRQGNLLSNLKFLASSVLKIGIRSSKISKSDDVTFIVANLTSNFTCYRNRFPNTVLRAKFCAPDDLVHRMPSFCCYFFSLFFCFFLFRATLLWLFLTFPAVMSLFSRSNAQLEPRGPYSRFIAQMTWFSPRTILLGSGWWVTPFGRNVPKTHQIAKI